jgi:hypothetical protein
MRAALGTLGIVGGVMVLLIVLQFSTRREDKQRQDDTGPAHIKRSTTISKPSVINAGDHPRELKKASRANSAPLQSTTHPLGDEMRAAIGNGTEIPIDEVPRVKNRIRTNRQEALEAMRVESDASIVMMIGTMLAEDPDAMADPAVINALRELAGDPVFTKREAALAALSSASETTRELIAQVTEISRNDSSEAVRISAVATMSTWMEKHPDEVEGMARELLLTAQSNDDPVVRGNAMQAIANQNVPLPDEVVNGMIQYLEKDPVAQNRQLAAVGTGGATGQILPKALKALESAYMRETHQDTRRVILMQLVRASGRDAAQLLGRLPAPNEVLQNDIRDYQSILARGITDHNEIRTQKSILDANRGTEVGTN